MRGTILMAGLAAVAFPLAAQAAEGDVSVDWGRHISIVGGCHDCHTAGYNESGGKIDPDAALKGVAVGWQGPWGTTYPKNLRLTAQRYSEDEWVQFAKTFKTLPPMPYYNVHEMTETDLRSLYQYIKSLGPAGDPAPAAQPPGEKPTHPYTVSAPPTMPGQ
jgi:cytochrome c553